MDNNHQMHKGDRVAKIIKPSKTDDDYREGHELSLLSLLVKKHPERAREFLKRLSESMKVA
jgi:hypothetical protein